jgi:hypothetical protein
MGDEMTGDKFQVFYHIAGNTIPHPLGPWDTWRDAKAMRNSSFFDFPEVRAAWIMRTNPSLDLRPEKYGETLRRNKHEIGKSCD